MSWLDKENEFSVFVAVKLKPNRKLRSATDN